MTVKFLQNMALGGVFGFVLLMTMPGCSDADGKKDFLVKMAKFRKAIWNDPEIENIFQKNTTQQGALILTEDMGYPNLQWRKSIQIVVWGIGDKKMDTLQTRLRKIIEAQDIDAGVALKLYSGMKVIRKEDEPGPSYRFDEAELIKKIDVK